MTQTELDYQMRKLGEELRFSIASGRPVSMIYAIVQSVDTDTLTATCETLAGYNIVTSLGVHAGQDTTCQLIPKIGSLVVVAFVEENPSASFVVAHSGLEAIQIAFEGGSEIAISKEEINAKAGNGALLNLSNVAELTNLKDTLSSLVDAVNNALSACVCAAPGSPIVAAGATPFLEQAKLLITQNFK